MAEASAMFVWLRTAKDSVAKDSAIIFMWLKTVLYLCS